jgi:uncharacterized protein YjiS (DUF1127 family)
MRFPPVDVSQLNRELSRRAWRHLFTTVARIVRAVANETRCRRAIRQMRMRDDRMLADIGLRRDGISRAARQGQPPAN